MADAKVVPKGGLSVRTVDPSEYEPQVVELPTANVEENCVEEEKTGSPGETGSGSPASRELTEEERAGLWVKNLQAMRERYLASLTEQERDNLFKTLEV